jgi:transposase
MAKRQYTLTDHEVNQLVSGYAQSQDGPTRTRCQAVRLYGTGYPVAQIIELTGCSRTSLMEWCHAYRQHGLLGLVDKRVGGNHAKLSHDQIDDLRQRLHSSSPRQVLGASTATEAGQFWTVEDVQAALKHWYQVEYQARSSILRLLGLCGFSYQRPSQVFKSRRAAEVRAFEEQLEKN